MAKILIIDDDLYIRKLLDRMLNRAGYQTVMAVDGNDGLKEFRVNKPDLVLVDVVMPEKDGLEMVFELLLESPGIKIIAMSGGGDRLGADECLNSMKSMGVSALIKKPFERQEILDLISYVLNEHIDNRKTIETKPNAIVGKHDVKLS